MARMKRNANGSGCIRKRADGRWEGIYSTAEVDGAGKYKKHSIYGKTQEEVRKKLTEITGEIDTGQYIEPTKLKLKDWLNTWLEVYAKPAIKQYSYDTYSSRCKNHIIPALGEIKLINLNATQIQRFYNDLSNKKNLSPKTIKNIHGILSKALAQAKELRMIRDNPCELCKLPRVNKKEIKTLGSDEIKNFLEQIKGNKYESIFYITLFTGLRQSEVLGLTWDCVDFNNSCITINKQLKLSHRGKGAEYILDYTKNDKTRILAVAPSVMLMLERQKNQQEDWAGKAGAAWDNSMNLVFTNELGQNLRHVTIYKHFKAVVKELGIDSMRFHDLRHTFAVVSLESGDDIKTLQDNMGHATSAFTLDTYGHSNLEMKKRSAQKMQQFINKVS